MKRIRVERIVRAQQHEMETTMGKVYRKDGKYLVRRESHTHTGFHTRFEWVDDVNDATVFYGDHGTRWRNLREAAAGADALDATETRTVTLAAADNTRDGGEDRK